MKIGQLAATADVNIETIRYYQRLKLLETPPKTGGIRNYSNQHLQEIQFIQRAKLAGFSLKEIQHLKTLDSVSDRPEILAISEQKRRELDQKIRELDDASRFISSLINECKSSDSQHCPILVNLKQTP